MTTWHLRLVLLSGWLVLVLSQSAMPQTVTVNTRDQLVRAVERAQPGTTVLIAPGTYPGGLHFHGLQGEAGKPIILAAADKENPPVFKGRNSCFHLTDPAFVELHNLILADARGNGINIDDGGSYETPAHHVVLRDLTVRDVGPEGNRDGIKLSGLDDFRVEDCILERWGSSGSAIDMVGCHKGEIIGCTFRHRGDTAGSGVQTKGGSKDIAIRRCRFENAGGRAVNIGGSTGSAYFRPKADGYEAKDITVEDCAFIGSAAPICFVGVDGAVVRYNTIYRPRRYVVRILQESRGSQFLPCRQGVFSNNVIAFQADETRGTANIGPGTAPETFKFAKNHWYCIDRPESSKRLSLPVEETGGSYGGDPQFLNVEKGDLRLQAASPVRDAGVRPSSLDFPLAVRASLVADAGQFQSVKCDGAYRHHLQGICTNDKDAIYWSFTTTLVKTDTNGKVVQKIEVRNHHGDLCHHDGKIYVAVNFGRFNDPQGNADSWVYVYDADDLSVISQHQTPEVFHGAGGIGYRDGRYFVVGGLPEGFPENYVYEYDGDFKFLKKHVIKSGHTLLGIQTAAYARGKWFFGCYGDPKILLVTDSDFNMLGRYEFDCSLGIVGLTNGQLLSASGRCENDKGCSGNARLVVPDDKNGLRFVAERKEVKDD